MAFGSLEGLRLIEVHRDLYRNIVSLRESRNLFDDLSDDPADWQAATELEMEHKPAHYQSAHPIIDRPFEEAEFNAAIQYPFDHWTVSRYSPGQFGVWYGSPEMDTTLHETAYHWREGLLADAGWEQVEGVSIERRVHKVYCAGALLNLLPQKHDWPELTMNDYTACQALGERIHREGHPGLWAPSARCEGTVAALFTPRLLSHPRTVCFLTYTLENDRVVVRKDRSETGKVL